MKKIIRVFLLVIGIFAIGGCSGKDVVTDVSSLNYLDSSSSENIAYNLALAADNLKSASFTGRLKVKGKTYNFSGEVIIKDSIENSIIHINYKNNNIYLKNKNIYLSYYYNNTNVIIKDSVDNFTDEVISLLKNYNVKCNESVIYDIIKNKGFEDINFDYLSKKIVEVDNGFVIDYKGSKTYLNNKYLPIVFSYSKKDISLSLNVSYNPVKISVPIGYDLINMQIEDVKDLLKVKNVSELIK